MRFWQLSSKWHLGILVIRNFKGTDRRFIILYLHSSIEAIECMHYIQRFFTVVNPAHRHSKIKFFPSIFTQYFGFYFKIITFNSNIIITTRYSCALQMYPCQVVHTGMLKAQYLDQSCWLLHQYKLISHSQERSQGE